MTTQATSGPCVNWALVPPRTPMIGQLCGSVDRGFQGPRRDRVGNARVRRALSNLIADNPYPHRVGERTDVMNQSLTKVVDGVWTASEPVSIVGMTLTASMSLLALPNGGLLVYSPVNLTPARKDAIAALGSVEHLYAPNLFHHSWLGQWAEAFPNATVHGPRGLSKKRADLRIDRVHGEPLPPDLIDVTHELPIEGFRLRESVLLHRPSATLVLADLVHNVGRPTQTWAKIYCNAMGFYDRVALSRAIRWTAFADRAAVRRSVDAIGALSFERVIVGHGEPILHDAKAALLQAFDWLPAS